MVKPIHSMIRVLDEDRSVAFYRQAFGLEIVDRLDFASFTLIYMADKDGGSAFELELTVNKDRTQPYDLGDGYGHMAFVTDDLDGMHARLAAGGHSPRDIVDFQPDGVPVARFFFIADPDGYQIEVLARGGRFT
ncbi:MAG: VOC family protein [Pseudomonadota bacterium]